jgi:hypothetical protein
MRLSPVIFAVLATWCFAGCTTYGGLPIYGAAHLLSSADYHEALAGIKKDHPDAKIHLFEVVSRNEVYVYYTPQTEGGYWIVTRANGRWKESGRTIVIQEPILFNGHINE